MFARLSRLFRAWMGYFISIGEDPEVMLQDAIEEMRMTMPKLNSVLVATRATVIRLEEERDALLQQDRNLSASIQAALRDGSAAARSVAEEDAIQLQQLPTGCEFALTARNQIFKTTRKRIRGRVAAHFQHVRATVGVFGFSAQWHRGVASGLETA